MITSAYTLYAWINVQLIPKKMHRLETQVDVKLVIFPVELATFDAFSGSVRWDNYGITMKERLGSLLRKEYSEGPG